MTNDQIESFKMRISNVIGHDENHWAIRKVLPNYQNFPKDLEDIIANGDLESFVIQLEAAGVVVNQQIQQLKLNEDALAYLLETDWYTIRFAETGVAIPEDVLSKRAAARLTIVRE